MRALATSAALLLLGCEPAYVEVFEPRDASFEIVCAPGCGPEGRDRGAVIAVSFAGGARQFSLCCAERAELLARLETIRDYWCDGLDVPAKTIGGLQVGTTVSEITEQRGATLDDGQGYVAFQCHEWLDELITGLTRTSCCAAPSRDGTRPPGGRP